MARGEPVGRSVAVEAGAIDGRGAVCGPDEYRSDGALARALVAKGGMLGQPDRAEDEIAAYGDVVERFGGRKELNLVNIVEMAKRGKKAAFEALTPDASV